jgi:hypothetical protein
VVPEAVWAVLGEELAGLVKRLARKGPPRGSMPRFREYQALEANGSSVVPILLLSDRE